MLSFRCVLFLIILSVLSVSPACSNILYDLPKENSAPDMPLIPIEFLDVKVPDKIPEEILSVDMPELPKMALSLIVENHIMLPPADGRISSPYGQRWGRPHQGIDIPLPTGTPIKAARDGVVAHSGTLSDYGKLVEIDHGDGLVTRYAHCSVLAVSAGETVSAGQVIAFAGSTGRSTASHLHFEVLINGVAHNPTKFLFGGF